MGRRAGTLLWRRMRIQLPANGVSVDIDTGLTQVNKNFADQSPGEPTLGVTAIPPGPLPGTDPASRIQVVPMAPLDDWQGVSHDEPYFDPTTGTIHVAFRATREVSINVLFWDPHSLIGPGQADTYSDELIGHEIWMIDQSNTFDDDGNGTLDSGGTLYIFNGQNVIDNLDNPANITPEVIDLGDWVPAIKAATGTAPVRPHWVEFSNNQKRAVLAWVSSGHATIINAETRQPITTFGGSANPTSPMTRCHTAILSYDNTFLLLTENAPAGNNADKQVHRINTDYDNDVYTYVAAATLDCAVGNTPSGALRQDPVLRPDTAPIYAATTLDDKFAFISFRRGGMFVINPHTQPMAIVNEYTEAVLQGGDGIVADQSGSKMYYVSGARASAPFESSLVWFPVGALSTTPNVTPNNPAPNFVFTKGGATTATASDLHDGALTKLGERFLLLNDRNLQVLTIVDTIDDSFIDVSYAGILGPAKEAPDIMAFSPDGLFHYNTFRGPIPLTGNPTYSIGAHPGLAINRMFSGGGGAELLVGFFGVSNVVNGVETADPHGIGVRRLA